MREHANYIFYYLIGKRAGALYTKSPVTSLRTVFCTFISLATSLSGLKVWWFDGSLVRWIVGSMDRWFDGSMVRWIGGSVVRWFDGSLVRWIVGSMDRWFDGSMDWWFSDLVNTWETRKRTRFRLLYSGIPWSKLNAI